jgi:hypothetical protein
MATAYQHVELSVEAASRPRHGGRTAWTGRQASLTFGMFRYDAASLGGCVQFQITNVEQIRNRVISRRLPRVKIGGLKAANQFQSGEELSLRCT